MPERRKEVRAVVTVARSREARVEVQSSLARQTWEMEERERFEARRCGISVSRVVPGLESGPGDGEGGWRDEVEEAMVRGADEGCRCFFGGCSFFLQKRDSGTYLPLHIHVDMHITKFAAGTQGLVNL